MNKCPYINVECDSDAPCCKECTLYIQNNIDWDEIRLFLGDNK